MSPPVQGWTTSDVEGATVRLLGKQGPFRATVRLVQVGQETLVAKDYRACILPFRWTVGLVSLRMESKALGRLRGLEGIPQVHGRVGRWILLMTYFRGNDLGKTRKALQTEEFFRLLTNLVGRMHERGVVHLDLRQRRNVMLRPGRRPAILDFGASLCLKPGGRLLRWLAPLDTSGVLKYKRRAHPTGLTDDEARLLHRVEKRRKWWPFG